MRSTRSKCRPCLCRTSSPSPPRAGCSATARSACPSTCGGRGATTRIRTKAKLHHVKATVAEHAAARGGAGHPAKLHPLRHRQEAPAHQGDLPLPAVLHHQPNRGSRGEGLPEEGPDLAFPGQRQVAADGLRRAEAADAPEAGQSHGDDRGGPHRPRHADHRHLQRRRRAEHGRRGDAAGVADAARRRTCARCSSPPSTSSARRAAS